MNAEASAGGTWSSPDRLDAWLDISGFADAGLVDWSPAPDAGADDSELDDPWGERDVGVSTLTTAQRSFLLGEPDDLTTGDDLLRADELIIDIPLDPGDIEPFNS